MEIHKLRVRFVFDSSLSQVYLLVRVAGLARYDRNKEEWERRLFVPNESWNLRTPLTQWKSHLKPPFDDGALSEPRIQILAKVSPQ